MSIRAAEASSLSSASCALVYSLSQPGSLFGPLNSQSEQVISDMALFNLLAVALMLASCALEYMNIVNRQPSALWREALQATA